MSSFGAAISSEQMNLLSRTFRYVVSAMDNDSVGKRATDMLHKRLTKKGCVVFDFDYNGLDVKDPRRRSVRQRLTICMATKYFT